MTIENKLASMSPFELPNLYEYLWLDAKNKFRSKIRILSIESDLLPPIWNYDGSSTGQAIGSDSEITLIPKRVFKNPLIDYERAFLVVCEGYRKDQPLSNNHRNRAEQLFNKHEGEHPWYGLEQEYFLINRATKLPLGFPANAPQGPYYCSGVNRGREIIERHLITCLKAGITLSGINAEVALGQWEFQVGPCEGVAIGDHMMAARFFLERVADQSGCDVDWNVKPLKGDWNGSGCHVNFSTLKMREGDESGTGLHYIQEAVLRLGSRHLEHLPIYGEGNEERLSGHHETSSASVFTWGVGDRSASIRIGGETVNNEKGYFEDRRPGSNIDPYLVAAKILASVMDEDY